MEIYVNSSQVYIPVLPKHLDCSWDSSKCFNFFNPGQKTRKTMLDFTTILDFYNTASLSPSILQVMQIQIWKKGERKVSIYPFVQGCMTYF